MSLTVCTKYTMAGLSNLLPLLMRGGACTGLKIFKGMMTVQEAIDELNKVEDKSKELKYFDTFDHLFLEIGLVQEHEGKVLIS